MGKMLNLTFPLIIYGRYTLFDFTETYTNSAMVSALLRFLHSFLDRQSLPKVLYSYVRLYLLSLDSIVGTGIMTASTVALVCHKIIIIRLHSPLSILGLVSFWPFLFVFDIITLILLHRGLASTNRAYRILASFLGLVITISSATFVSLYLSANAELNWGRSVEVYLIGHLLI